MLCDDQCRTNYLEHAQTELFGYKAEWMISCQLIFNILLLISWSNECNTGIKLFQYSCKGKYAIWCWCTGKDYNSIIFYKKFLHLEVEIEGKWCRLVYCGTVLYGPRMNCKKWHCNADTLASVAVYVTLLQNGLKYTFNVTDSRLLNSTRFFSVVHILLHGRNGCWPKTK